MSTPEKIYTGDPLLYNEEIENDLERFQEHSSNSPNLPDWLEFHSSFPRTGKQGVLGLLTDRDGEGKKYVYKISQYLNYMADQEYTVMNGLNSIRDFCPHFCKTYGKFKTEMIDTFRSVDNPFEYDQDDRHIENDVLIMEHIDDCRKLYRYIKNDHITPEIVMSIIKQVMIATTIASEQLRFTHYDMHSNNVLIKKCAPNSAFFYILDENRTYLTPTFGYYPIIIDFGFSFNKNCEGKPFYGSLAHTDVGFIPSVFDQHSDPKLFLSSVSYEFKRYKRCDTSIKFRNLIRSIYQRCNVDLECGWDTRETYSISNQLLKKMNNQFRRSSFFKEQGHHIVDMLQSLVELPLSEKYTKDTIEDLTAILVTEFLQIEKVVNGDFDKMYILKGIISSCVTHKKDYLDKDKRDQAVTLFKRDVLKCIDSVVSYCNPKINWEKLLCSLLCLSKCIGNYCFDKLRKLMAVKKSDYNKMPLRSQTEILESIDANFPSHFFFDDETVIYVWDCVEKKSYKTKLTEEMVLQINQTHPFERGMVLYEYLSSKE